MVVLLVLASCLRNIHDVQVTNAIRYVWFMEVGLTLFHLPYVVMRNRSMCRRTILLRKENFSEVKDNEIVNFFRTISCLYSYDIVINISLPTLGRKL